MKPVAEKAGWKYVFVDVPLSDDDAVSAMQSKYVKFLQFLKDRKFSFFKQYEKIVYADHKTELKDRHIDKILAVMDKPVLIRKHRDARRNIWEEVEASMDQERYRRFMPRTLEYIKSKTRNGCSADCRHCSVCTTSLIAYDLRDKEVYKFLDELYRDLSRIGTSQCQIIWFIVQQHYPELIQAIEQDVLDVRWRQPKPRDDFFIFSWSRRVAKFLRARFTTRRY